MVDCEEEMEVDRVGVWGGWEGVWRLLGVVSVAEVSLVLKDWDTTLRACSRV